MKNLPLLIKNETKTIILQNKLKNVPLMPKNSNFAK